MKKIFLFLVTSVGFIAFLGGASSYSGSLVVYTFYSLVFFALLVSGLSKRAGFGYLFLTIFLWLGFWFKFTAHLVFHYPYEEPVGQFHGSPGAWDSVLLVSSVAAMGVLAGRLLYWLFNRFIRPESVDREDNMAGVPIWYASSRKPLWIAAIAIVVVVTVINVTYGIQQIGLAPRTILMWPGNAAIAWMMDIGCAMMVTTLAWWEFGFERKVAIWAVFMIMGEALVSSVSILSRSAYLFHSVPQLFAICKCRNGFSRPFSNRKWLIVIMAFVALLAFSIAGVTTLRSYLYPHRGGFTTASQKRMTRIEVLNGGIGYIRRLIAKGQHRQAELQGLLNERAKLERLEAKHAYEGNVLIKPKKKAGGVAQKAKESSADVSLLDVPSNMRSDLWSEFKVQLEGAQLKTIIALGANRWIGLEGVMALSAYPNKGADLFMKGLLEKRAIGKTSLYQYICNSSYRWTDASTWEFASLPGAVAFLYYSGSRWVVFLGMMLFTLLLLFWERLVYLATKNPLMCSFLGLAIANAIAQFGITPRQDIPYYALMLCSVLFIWLLRSNWLAGRLKSLAA